MSSASAPPPNPTSASRTTWILVFTLAAIIVGGIAGLLSHANGVSVPGAILTGGSAFAGTFGLLLAVAYYARGS
jgi:hypothetical protein